MAVLPDGDRVNVWAQWMRDNIDTIAILKAELRAAVNATDVWINDNQASFNAALPEPAKSGLTAKQKERLFMAVAARRFSI